MKKWILIIIIVFLVVVLLVAGFYGWMLFSIFFVNFDEQDPIIDGPREEIESLFSEDQKMALYPDSRQIRIKPGEKGAFALGIRNLLPGQDSEEKEFRYETTVANVGDCQNTEDELEDLILSGKSSDVVSLKPGDERLVEKIILFVPEDFQECSFIYRVSSYAENEPYDTKFMDVEIVE